MYVRMSATLAFTQILKPDSCEMSCTDMRVKALDNAPCAVWQQTFEYNPPNLYIQPEALINAVPRCTTPCHWRCTYSRGRSDIESLLLGWATGVRFQTGPLPCWDTFWGPSSLVPYWYRDLFPKGQEARARTWRIISIQFASLQCMELHLHTLCTPLHFCVYERKLCHPSRYVAFM